MVVHGGLIRWYLLGALSLASSLCGKLLSALASPVMKKAYEKGLSIWEAKDELAKLQVTIRTIHAVLLDAEKKLAKQEGSAAIKDWMKRLKDVLYDADDLFDDVTTDELLKQQIMKDSKKHFLKKQVHMSCSKLNPINSRNSIAKKVKAIRESLDDISKDMAQFNFVTCLNEEPISNMRRDQGILVDSKNVIGREDDKTTILEMLAKESDKVPTVIAIVGIGGMGKSTLAQLVYDNLEDSFQNRWYACISDTSDEKEVIGKILRSISVEKDYRSFDVHELQIEIRKSIVGKKFLLVLDDVWDDDRGRWLGRISLLSGGAKGSKVVVTTRSPLVARAVGALETHNLEGLSDVDSWDLFRSVAFLPGDENDPRREIVGREIVKKCRNVPLAIRSIASLLFEKHTIVEWENLKNQELSNLEEQRSAQQYSILPVLKVSYHHLRSNLKHCFAYCSLFPEDFVFDVTILTNLWISQGYIKPNVDSETLEQASHSYFMHLLRRGFFQEASKNAIGEVESCKMHDLIHDLARHVAGEESKMLTSTSFNASNCARHVSLRDSIDYRWVNPTQLGNGNKLRSLLFMSDLDTGRRLSSSNLDQLCANFKLLRSLDLSWSWIESVPSCIGELKHLSILIFQGTTLKFFPIP